MIGWYNVSFVYTIDIKMNPGLAQKKNLKVGFFLHLFDRFFIINPLVD